MLSVLIIDDDKISHSFIKRALKDNYKLSHTYSGEEGLEKAAVLTPEIILLDIEMPGMNGYEVCEILKASDSTKHTPIIFLSSLSSLTSRMQGFEAGADDYIVKPFQPEDLNAKLQVVGRYRRTEISLTHQVVEAQKTAYSAIAGNSDLGQAMSFIEQCHWVTNYNQLAEAFFRISSYLNLTCTLVITNDNEEHFFSSTNHAVPPLESELISTLRHEGRFFDFGCRTQINYQNISLLIKNMPLDDMERYGRIKDIFPAMLSTADSKINQLETLKTINNHSDQLSQSFKTVTTALNKIKTSIEESQRTGINILRDMLNELDNELPRMGLEDDQEQYLINTIDTAITESEQATAVSKQLSDYFSLILKDLEQQLDKQQQLQTSLTDLISEDSDSDNNGYSMDIELF
ncbi:MAG: response regulator [Gammaproteobacteria bacterium]|nr:response regulator [Gammaproteobacteria bacterium]